LVASVDIPHAGEWDFQLVERLGIFEQHIGGPAPLFMSVSPGPSHAATSRVEFAQTLTAGDTFEATVTTLDLHENPTDWAGDAFLAKINADEIDLDRLGPGAFGFSKVFRTAGIYIFAVTHEEELVGGEQNVLQVTPAAADATASKHNIDFEDYQSHRSEEAELELRVYPFDSFNNSVPTASGYAVTIDGGDPTPLLSPSFSYTHKIPEGFSGTLKLDFTLNGTSIANSPVTLDVAPDNTVLYMGIICGVFLFVFGVSNWLYAKFGKRGINAKKEKEVSVDVKLRKILDNKIRMQDTMLLIEVRKKAGGRRERASDWAEPPHPLPHLTLVAGL
jgi:hypothetical protein